MELLLDETLCQGTIKIPKKLAREAGGINHRLEAKQKYELLLRIAMEHSFVLEDAEACVQEEGCGMLPEIMCADTQAGALDEDWLVLEDDLPGLPHGWKTDCYVIGKYSGQLQESGCFDAAACGILQEAAAEGRTEETLAYLEDMIGRRERYYLIDDVTRPILIYKGDKVCHNVLTVFAEQFGNALERQGEHVIYFDDEEEDINNILRYTNQRFKAIVGMQSYLFSVRMRDEVHYLHEQIYGPKYNFVFDHPLWFRTHLMHHYPDFHVLTHDMNYVNFTKRYFRQDAILFPPAGMWDQTEEETERIYDLTFVGTYGDYMEQIRWIHQLDRPRRFLANKFLLMMRKNPDMTVEEAFAATLERCHIALSEEAFAEQLFELRRTVYCVMHYYRSKVIETLVKNGLQVDVFGDSWYRCPLRKYSKLACHPDVTVGESLGIWRQSKLSLNIMSWHKGGFTERMAGIMLAGAVLATDDTTYLHGRYDADDLLIFDLTQLDALPGQIRGLLADEKRRQKIAGSGAEKTRQEHTWDKRAEQFLALLDRK